MMVVMIARAVENSDVGGDDDDGGDDVREG